MDWQSIIALGIVAAAVALLLRRWSRHEPPRCLQDGSGRASPRIPRENLSGPLEAKRENEDYSS